MNKKKRFIVLTLAVAFVFIFVAVYFLNSKFHFLADTVSDSACTIDHPYTVKAGRQDIVNTTGKVSTNMPGIPKNYLFIIAKDDVLREFNNAKPDNRTIVCYEKNNIRNQIPSYIDPSGEIWFQSPEDIPQETEAKFYISTIASESSRLNLVNSEDIETHSFRDDSDFTKNVDSTTTKFWRKTEWFATGAPGVDYSFSNDVSPGGDDTLLVEQPSQVPLVTPNGWNSRLLGDSFQYVPVAKATPEIPAQNTNLEGTYYIATGWVKYVDAKVLRDGQEAITPARFAIEMVSNQYRNGSWDSLGAGNRSLAVSTDVSTDWERYINKTPLGGDRIGYQFEGRTGNSLKSGKMYYSSFRFIKNIKAPLEYKVANVSWSDNSSRYFGKAIAEPQKIVNYSGSPFSIDQSTKLFLTNDFSNYYKEHYDGSNLVITEKLQQILSDKRNVFSSPHEIKDFKGEKSIIIGDFTNVAFKNFVSKLRPDINNFVGENDTEFNKEGYKIFVGEKYILAIGKNMVGSYYASLRLADLLSENNVISQRTEEDWPDSGFRSLYTWDFTQWINQSDPNEVNRVKSDIKRSSGLRYNSYAINGPFEYASLHSPDPNPQRTMMIDLFSYSRKYFMEPVPSSFSFGFAYGPAKDYESLLWAERSLKFSSTVKSYEISTYISSGTPIIVKSKDGNTTYTQGADKDYIIEEKERSATDKTKVFFITIPSTSTIQPIPVSPATTPPTSNYELKATFNGRRSTSKMSNRLSSPAARATVKKAIENAIDYLHPKYIHINNDEIVDIASDYRDLYNNDGSPTGNTPTSMFADFINFLYKSAKDKDPNIQIIMWDDVINPYHAMGWVQLTNKKPYPYSAVDLIPKDIIIDEWFVTSGKSLNCQHIESAANYHLKKGFRIIAGPLVQSDFESYECFSRLAKSNPQKFVGYHIPQWVERHEDKPQANILSKWIWNFKKSTTEQSNASPVWVIDDFITSPLIHSVNITEGQTITSNPYILSVKVKDASRVEKVEYYIDNILIGAATLPDVNGVFDWPWDTSKYHSIVKIIVYGTDGQTEEITRNTTVDLSGGQQATNPIVAVLPKTGENNLKITALNIWNNIKRAFGSE